MKNVTLAEKRAKQREYSKSYYHRRKEQEKKEQIRKSKRDWWRANRSKAALAAKTPTLKPDTKPLLKPTNIETNGDIINIINAYYVLHAYTNDGQVVADLNKVFTNIITKTQR